MFVKLFNKTIEIKTDEIGICWVEFCDDKSINYDFENDNIIQKQFTEYEKGIRKLFDLPLHIVGTEFQKKVWNALLEIPFGETRSYQEIAIRIGNPKAVRAVGGACNRNPIGIIVPCHRVVGKNGSLTGYAGGLDYKKMLLEHEKMG